MHHGTVVVLISLFLASTSGCDTREKKCEDFWKEINECVASQQPAAYSGDCVFILPESFPGEFSCEGGRDLASFEEFCLSNAGIDASTLSGCLDQCESAPTPSSDQEYLELTADTAACLGLEGWPGEVRWMPEWVSMKSGDTREARLRIEKSPPFPIAFELSIADGDEGKISFEPDVAVFNPGVHFATVTLTANENVDTEISAVYDGNSVGDFQADLPVLVKADDYECGGEAQQTVGKGDRLEVPDASGNEGLAGSFIEFPPDNTLEDVDVTISCGGDIVTGDYIALGPAVEFSPGHKRFMRELDFGIPINPSGIHEEASVGHVAIFYTGPGVSPRKVLVGNKWINVNDGSAIISFMSPRFGTYQAAIDPMAGKRSFTRHFTYRGITGVSMGALGATLVGLRNHEEFDFVGPLGGPSNWTAMLNYISKYHLGGFCTADDTEGDIGEHCPVEPPSEMFEFSQDFEHWFYPDGRDGQGGTFNREDYCQIFRDITRAFGNPGMYNEDSTYLPPGVTEEWLKKSESEKCSEGGAYRLEGFYDRKYNPDGSFPVITFCDGAEWRDGEGNRDIGRWDPEGDQFYPLDIALAVDVNDNGKRDEAEPVISQSYEPYDDVGADATPSSMEDGYDAETNPDPVGDNFDYQFNPGGKEGNHLYDEGEPYLDYGLDGVDETPQQGDGGYDYGEGNGKFDYSPNVLNFWEHDAYHIIRNMTEEELLRLDIMTDAGIRDLFDFAPGINAMIGAVHERGHDVNMWRNFAPLYGSDDEYHFDSTRVDYNETMGKNFVIIYGEPDAEEEALVRGDGGHVGTPMQILNRLMTVTMAMSARWPGGNREDSVQQLEEYLFTIDFHAVDRHSQVSIFLPPGYYNEENFDEYYPVVYFLHGYGQEPNDLILSAIIFGNNMISNQILKEERMQKVIMVFPDGRCRYEDDDEEWQRECLKGSFYGDSLWNLDSVKGPQMESIFLELIEYIDAEYRTKAAEDVVVSY